MRIPRTIGFRITLGFGILIIALVCSTMLSYRIVARIQSTQEELSSVLEPSLHKLIEGQNIVRQSGENIRAWIYTGRDFETISELNYSLQTRLPDTDREILKLSDDWTEEDRQRYLELHALLNDSLYEESMLFIRSMSTVSASDSLSSATQLNGLMDIYGYVDNKFDFMVQRFDDNVVQANEGLETEYINAGNILLITGIVIVIAAIAIALLLYFALVNPIRQYSDAITSMGKGIIPDKEFREGSDELGQIGAALNSMIKGLRDLSVFAEEIGKGNFKSEFTPLSKEDILGNSLIRLREDLMNAAIEEEKRKREDERRNWSNQGIARFSEILREHSGDTKTLADMLISELVNYLGARVGGIFLIRQKKEEPGDIELIASYAYERTKHIKKTIKPGEGLVGRCVQEGSTIFLTDIPEGYIKIKSGLGEDDPKSLIIVPVRLNELIVGVMEIASLEVIQDFQIEFVERIGSSIASSLSG